MEENRDVELNFYKVRSYSSCLMKGFKLFADNLWTILKSTWTSVLLFALCVAVCSFLYRPLARVIFTFADPSKLPYFSQMLFGLLLVFLLTVATLASSFFGGQLTVMFRNYVQTGHLQYTGKGSIVKAAMEANIGQVAGFRLYLFVESGGAFRIVPLFCGNCLVDLVLGCTVGAGGVYSIHSLCRIAHFRAESIYFSSGGLERTVQELGSMVGRVLCERFVLCSLQCVFLYAFLSVAVCALRVFLYGTGR